MKNNILFLLFACISICKVSASELTQELLKNPHYIQKDRKILIFKQGQEPYIWEILRFNQDKTPDFRFGSGGKIGIIAPFDFRFTPQYIGVNEKGIIVATYLTQSAKGKAEQMQTLVSPDGATFYPSKSGKIIIPISEIRQDELQDQLEKNLHTIQPDGKILIFRQGERPHIWEILRYNKDATLDATFGHGGKMGTLDAPGNSYTPLSISVEKDGTIIATYLFTLQNGQEELIQERISPNGIIPGTRQALPKEKIR